MGDVTGGVGAATGGVGEQTDGAGKPTGGAREPTGGRRGLAILALPGVALAAAALAGGAARVAVPPSGAVLLLGLVAGGLALRRRRVRGWLPVAAAALLGVAAAHVHLLEGVPFGHDTVSHLWGSWAFAREVAGGDLHPRWLHQIGLGTPLLQFYGPLTYYALLPFAALGVGWPGVLAAGSTLFAAAAAVAMYHAVGAWVPDRRAALVAAAAYAFAPYRLLDASYRFALAETAAFALLPLVLLVSTRRARQARPMGALPAVAAAALVLTHPLSAMIALLGHLAWLAAEAALERPGWRPLLRRAVRLGGSWLLGGALAAFFVLPALAEMRFTSVGLYAPREGLARHALAPGDLLRRTQWDALRVDGMPLYFGAVLLAVLVLAAAGGGGRRLPAGLLGLGAVGLLLPLHPFAGIAERLVPPLALLQFPWRLLTLATCAAAAAAAFVAARTLRRPSGAALAFALVGLLLVDAAPYTGAAEIVPPAAGVAALALRPGCTGAPCLGAFPLPVGEGSRVAGVVVPPPGLAVEVGIACCVFLEYTIPEVQWAFDRRDPGPAGAVLVAPPDGPPRRLAAAPLATWQPAPGAPAEPRAVRRGGGEIRVAHDGRPGVVVVREQAFPGWRVLGDGGWADVVPTASGLLQAAVGPGREEVRFRFTERRWDRAAGWGVSAVAALGLLASAWRAGGLSARAPARRRSPAPRLRPPPGAPPRR